MGSSRLGPKVPSPVRFEGAAPIQLPGGAQLVEVEAAQLRGLDRNGSGHVTIADLPLDGRWRLEGRTPAGAKVVLELDGASVGLAARLFEYVKHHRLEGVVPLSTTLLTEGPTQRALLACDSYAASLRRVDPAHLLDTLLAHVDPKTKVFAGGLRDPGGAPGHFPVVAPDGRVVDRPAHYDGRTLYVYVPAHEEAVIAELRRRIDLDPKYQAIAVEPLTLSQAQGFEERMALRFDRPGVIWCSTSCPLLPELQDDGYLVPGARFGIEAYYHDARINAPGARSTIDALIARGGADDRAAALGVLSAIRGTVNLFVNQIHAVGKVMNGNHTVYLGRSQPPCLTTCIKEVAASWALLHPGDPVEAQRRETWVRWATAAAEKEYREIWMSAPRLDPQTGLSRYLDEAPSQAPEEQAGHYEGLHWSADDLRADAAIREHGWDSHVGALAMVGPERGQIRQHQMLPVCLNSLLYRYERDLVELLEGQGKAENAEVYRTAAEQRRQTMDRLMWNEERGLYFDLLELPGGSLRKNGYEDLRSYTALWAGLVEPGSRRAQKMAARIVDFMRPGGLATATRESWDAAFALNPEFTERCQWGHQHLGWPIATYETAVALRGAGFNEEADQIAYRWCWAVQSEMERQGGLQYSRQGGFEAPILEKMDVTHLSAAGLAEVGYGNQGAGQEGEGGGFRWGYDAYKLLARSLPPPLLEALARGTDPELVFGRDPRFGASRRD